MSITTINAQMVHFEAFGRGKPVLFVHGWLGSWRYWWPTMQALSSHHRSFAIDLWGFGESSRLESNYTLETYVEMLGEFVEKLGIAHPFTLVGHSLGAAVALYYARSRPDLVERVASVSLPLSADHINGHLAGKSAQSIVDRSKNKFAAFPEVVMGLEKTDATAITESIDQIGQLDITRVIGEIHCPVLFVFGARDTLVRQPLDLASESPEEFAARHYVSLEDCTHFPMLEQPAIFNRLLREFIDGTEEENLAPKNYWQRRTR